MRSPAQAVLLFLLASAAVTCAEEGSIRQVGDPRHLAVVDVPTAASEIEARRDEPQGPQANGSSAAPADEKNGHYKKTRSHQAQSAPEDDVLPRKKQSLRAGKATIPEDVSSREGEEGRNLQFQGTTGTCGIPCTSGNNCNSIFNVNSACNQCLTSNEDGFKYCGGIKPATTTPSSTVTNGGNRFFQPLQVCESVQCVFYGERSDNLCLANYLCGVGSICNGDTGMCQSAQAVAGGSGNRFNLGGTPQMTQTQCSSLECGIHGPGHDHCKSKGCGGGCDRNAKKCISSVVNNLNDRSSWTTTPNIQCIDNSLDSANRNSCQRNGCVNCWCNTGSQECREGFTDSVCRTITCGLNGPGHTHCLNQGCPGLCDPISKKCQGATTLGDRSGGATSCPRNIQCWDNNLDGGNLNFCQKAGCNGGWCERSQAEIQMGVAGRCTNQPVTNFNNGFSPLANICASLTCNPNNNNFFNDCAQNGCANGWCDPNTFRCTNGQATTSVLNCNPQLSGCTSSDQCFPHGYNQCHQGMCC